jgi:hypothetical protein
MNTLEIIQPLLPLLATFLLGLIGSVAYWAKFKTRLHAVRNFVDAVDESIYDDKITEQEFRTTWEAGKKIIS